MEIERDALLDILYGAVKDVALLVWDDSLTALTEADGGGIQATFARGKPRQFDLVIGCDGLHSGAAQAVVRPRGRAPPLPRAVLLHLHRRQAADRAQRRPDVQRAGQSGHAQRLQEQDRHHLRLRDRRGDPLRPPRPGAAAKDRRGALRRLPLADAGAPRRSARLAELLLRQAVPGAHAVLDQGSGGAGGRRGVLRVTGGGNGRFSRHRRRGRAGRCDARSPGGSRARVSRLRPALPPVHRGDSSGGRPHRHRDARSAHRGGHSRAEREDGLDF